MAKVKIVRNTKIASGTPCSTGRCHERTIKNVPKVICGCSKKK